MEVILVKDSSVAVLVLVNKVLSKFKISKNVKNNHAPK